MGPGTVISAAYEFLYSGPGQPSINEVITEFKDAATARQKLDDGRAAVLSIPVGCSIPANQVSGASSIMTFKGSLDGSVPTSCIHPGGYFKTLEQVSDSAGVVVASGMDFTVLCDRWSISLEIEIQGTTPISDALVSGFMNSAVGKFQEKLNP
jgi:hypothetical protein